MKKKKYFRINEKGKIEYSDEYNEELGFIGITDTLKSD